MANNIALALKFLKGLKYHNDREWFEEHRSEYEISKGAFEVLVAESIGGVGAFFDVGGVAPKECIFRIYRDVRFSPNKLPYKSHMGAVIGPHGKSGEGFGFYLHLEPEGESMIAGGMHMPTSAQLTKFRNAISTNPARYRKIIQSREFKTTFGEIVGDTLKTAPQGFSKDHPQIELLRMKQILAIRKWSDAEVSAPSFSSKFVSAARVIKPLLDYLKDVTA